MYMAVREYDGGVRRYFFQSLRARTNFLLEHPDCRAATTKERDFVHRKDMYDAGKYS